MLNAHVDGIEDHMNDELLADTDPSFNVDSKSDPSDDTAFKVGQAVTWRSQAGGIWATKTGTVIEVVPEGHPPTKMSSTSSRKHTSYIVEVPRKAKNPNRPVKPELYWPVVSQLKLANAKKAKSDKIKLPKSKKSSAKAVAESDSVGAHSEPRDLGSDGGQGDPPDYEAALRRGLANGLGITDVNDE